MFLLEKSDCRLVDLGGRLCTFSPCIEQVQRTCQKLSLNGFEDIKTIECLRRTHDFRYQHRPKIQFTVDTLKKTSDKPNADKPSVSDDEEEKNENENGRHEEDSTSNKRSKTEDQPPKKRQATESDSILAAVGPLVMPGHTGYLTFAYLKQD